MALEFLTAALGADDKKIMTSKILKQKYFQSRILYPAKLSIRVRAE